MTATEAVGEPTGAMGVLGGEGMVVTKGTASLEVAKLAWEVPGFHAVAAGGQAGPTGLHPDGQLFELILEVAEGHFLLAVSYHLRVRWPVG